MKLFTIFSVLLVCLMLVFQGDSSGYQGSEGMPLHLSALHRKPFRSATKNKTAVLRIIHPPENDSVLSSIVEKGAYRGLYECQKMFQNSDWPPSCTVEMYKTLPIFNNTPLRYATREKSLIHAISAAAITHEIARQCRKGKIPGCGDSIEFGVNVSKRFTDRLEKGNDSFAAFNLYSNEVGREVVRKLARQKCRCFGWHCRLKTCWRELAPFKDVASKLKEKHREAMLAGFLDNKLRPRYSNGDFTSFSRFSRFDGLPPLVYLHDSPGICERNETLGYPGMLGNTCNKKASEFKCELFPEMCKYCNLKVKTVQRYKKVKCRCKFVYSSKVECETCTKKYSVMICIMDEATKV